MLSYYKKLLGLPNDTLFLNKYIRDPAIKRLAGIGYFCGMDFASKDIYDFSEYISRFDHSLNVALLVYKLTKDKTMAIAGLYHDVATPCFSHVIDYMNKDYLNQESTESYTKDILEKDFFLQSLLEEDEINLEDIINYKKYSIVDNKRPKLCADRLDAIILNSIGWLKNISKKDIADIINNTIIINNEQNEKEIGFLSDEIAIKAKYYNDEINQHMHSNYDIYMMQLLAIIVKYALNNNYISIQSLYLLNEAQLFKLLNETEDEYIKRKLDIFYNIKKKDIPKAMNIEVKNRNLKPLTLSRRIN